MFCSAAAGIMNARRFSYLLAWARTDMDPDKWVIFAYEGMTAYQDPALPAPYIQSLCSPPPPPRHCGKGIKPSESDNQG